MNLLYLHHAFCNYTVIDLSAISLTQIIQNLCINFDQISQSVCVLYIGFSDLYLTAYEL
jgi:hypothetical protein